MTKLSSLSSTPKSTKKKVTRSRATAVSSSRGAKKNEAIETVPDVQSIVSTVAPSPALVPEPVLPITPYVSGPSVTDRGQQQTKKFALWVVVSAMMFLIVSGWAWSLRYSLVVPETVAPSEDFLSATDDLSTLFQKTVGQIKSIELPTPPTEEVDQTIESAPPLTDEEMIILKQKVIDATTPKTLPVQP